MNRIRIAQRLTQIAVCCSELKGVVALPYGRFAAAPAHHRLAERDLQLIVDSAVDANNEVLLAAGRPPPPRYFETFIELASLGVLPKGLARRLAATTGLRNRLVHQYETVDLRLLHRAIAPAVRHYLEYIRRVRRHAGL